MIAPLFCWRMIGIAYFAARMQLLRLIATQLSIACFRDLKQFGIAAGKTDADIVVKDVEAAPAFRRFLHHRLEVALLGDIGLEGCRLAAFRFDQADGFLRGGKIAVDAQHMRAFARKGDRGGAAVAHAFARALARADHDGDPIFQPHVVSLPERLLLPGA